MKKVLIYIFISTVLLNSFISPFISINVAHAQGIDRSADSPVVGGPASTALTPAAVPVTNTVGSTGDDIPGIDFASQAEAVAVSGSDLVKKINNNEKLPGKQATADCGLSYNPLSWPSGMFCKIISGTLLPLASAMLALTARAFDLVVNLSLFTINTAIAENGPAGFIYTSWAMIRDICNMLGLFFFLISCFYMVMGKGLETRKYVVKLMIFAVLLNFSFPISKAILDFSNIFALNMYGSMTNYRYKDNAQKGVLWDDYGISYELMKIIGLQEPVSKSGDINPNTPILSGIDGTFTILALIVMIMALGVVFAQATALFMTRTLLMLFAIITSPIMFMGGILPPNPYLNIDSLVDWWIKKFVGGAFLAPIMMLNLAISLQIMKFAMGLTSNAKIVPTGDSFIKIVMMILSILAFQKTVEYSAKMLDGIGEKAAAIGGRIGGKMMSAGVARPAAFATRRAASLAGKMGGWVSDKTGIGRAANNLAGQDNTIGRMARSALKTIDTGSQSVRNSSMNVLGGATKMASFGKIDNIVTEQGGINRDEAEKEKDRAESAKMSADNTAVSQGRASDKAAKISNKAFAKSEELKQESSAHTENADQKEKELIDLEKEELIKEREIKELEDQKEEIESSSEYKSKLRTHQLESLALVEPKKDALWSNDQKAVKEIQNKQDQLDKDLYKYKEDVGLINIGNTLSDNFNKLDQITKSIAKINKERDVVIKAAEQARAKSDESLYAGIDAAGDSIAAAEQAKEAEAKSDALAPDVNKYRDAFKKYESADKAADTNSLSAQALLKIVTEKPKKDDVMTQILKTLKKKDLKSETK